MKGRKQQGRQAGDQSGCQGKGDRREEDRVANLTAEVASGALRVYMCISVNPSMFFPLFHFRCLP